MANFEQWAGFEGRNWKSSVDVRDFIQENYTPYEGDESFLEGPTEATDKLWGKLQELQKEERAKGGVLDMETEVVSGLTAYGPGYIDESMKDLEQVVGLQTDKPLKRAFMPHFHIPLQSGSDDVLKLMRRRYDTALFASKIRKIREIMPNAFIGVDVIVGTRGETEEYFEDAYHFIEGLDVTQLHVFTYSERPGTQALKIEYVVSPEEKHRRSQRLLVLSDEKTKAFYTSHIGKEAWVLMEKSKVGTPMHGFTDNYIRVEMDHDDQLDNQLIRVRMGGFNEEGTALKGVLV